LRVVIYGDPTDERFLVDRHFPQMVYCEQKKGELMREIRPFADYGSKIAVTGDLFADDSELWENA